MQPLREMLARGGIATLALVFTLAFATFYLANALAQIVVSAIAQHIESSDTGFFSFLSFKIAGTQVEYSRVLQSTLTLLLVAGCLYSVWRLTGRDGRVCPECRSEVAQEASVCRYCRAALQRRPR